MPSISAEVREEVTDAWRKWDKCQVKERFFRKFPESLTELQIPAPAVVCLGVNSDYVGELKVCFYSEPENAKSFLDTLIHLPDIKVDLDSKKEHMYGKNFRQKGVISYKGLEIDFIVEGLPKPENCILKTVLENREVEVTVAECADTFV